MVRSSVKETDEGIVGLDVTEAFDQMQRRFRDRGLIETKALIESGISSGRALEIGPGPGYTGLLSSLGAAYTREEFQELVPRTAMADFRIKADPFGLALSGRTGPGSR